MLPTILSHTPIWVFGLFAALLALGISQMFTRQMGVLRANALPVIMVVLSLAGTLTAFPGSAIALACWAVALAITVALLLPRPAHHGATFHPNSQRFTVPGSKVPLALMMGIFFTKYAVSASLGFHPEWAHEPVFSGAASAAYGFFSGVFAARGLRLRRLMQATRPTPSAPRQTSEHP